MHTYNSNYGYKETEENVGKVIVRNFNMVNLLTSRSNNRDHEKQAKNLFRIARAFSTRGCGIPTKMNLGGTPLDESLISMNQIIPEFKTRTGAQKVHVVCLTDGEVMEPVMVKNYHMIMMDLRLLFLVELTL